LKARCLADLLLIKGFLAHERLVPWALQDLIGGCPHVMALILALYKLDQVRTIALGFRNMSIKGGLCVACQKVFATLFKIG
jgi:hypothetical protein